MRRDLPAGTVTFLFTDIEGSTKLLHELGAEAYAKALAEHRRILREAFTRHGGVEVDTQGDAFFVAFPTAPGALAAAADAQRALADGPIHVRMGFHTGTPNVAEEGYVGPDVHRAERIAAVGHGGQVLVSAATAALVGTQGLRDLGEHRLKDLSAPERIYQLGEADFPPLTSLRGTNLPVPSTPFLGRERELGEIVDLVSLSGVRAVTLTGPGGTGKTRLAAQAAGELRRLFPDGVWWVPLTSLRDPALVLPTAGQAVGANDGLAEHIADRSTLLVFDNFEHVVDAATDVAALLTACPRLAVLVTSREPLHISGEREYPVPPLAPDEAVEFFTSRARAARPDFEPDEHVTAICRRLDDLPLALELAAARIRVLGSRQILERLDRRLPLLTGGARDVPERQRTLRATIEWSHELLDPEEQRLFARLAVFRGGCTLEAAEDLADTDLDTLESLVDKSLLRHTDDRFRMLETMREYASEQLEASGEAEELERRHAEHFLALAEEAEPHLRGSPKEWLDRLEAEHDNLRAALDRLQESGETQLTLRLAGALSKFWNMRSHRFECRRRLEGALAADERPTAARAKALIGAAGVATDLGDHATAKLRAEEAIAIHETLGDGRGTAESRFMLGYAAVEEGDFERAQPILEQSVRDFRDLGDAHYTLVGSFNLAWAYSELGDLERARAIEEESLSLARAASNERMEAMFLGSLESSARREGRFEDALAMLGDALRIYRNQGDRFHTAATLCGIARVFAATERERTAAQLVARAEVLQEELGTSPLWLEKGKDETLAAIRTQLDEAAFAETWEQGRALTMDQAVALALDSGALPTKPVG